MTINTLKIVVLNALELALFIPVTLIAIWCCFATLWSTLP